MNYVEKNLSKITGGATELWMSAKVLGQYSVDYYRCVETGFIQTQSPFWLDEAYANAITDLDIGLLDRNVRKAELSSRIISKSLPDAKQFLDFGGGYGTFTRLMRDRGFNFKHFDIHCKNLFAPTFEIDQLPKDVEYDLTTAWEVMEHVVDPNAIIKEVMKCSNAFLFSTELIPENTPRNVEDWWYFAPETGQHINFYTAEALKFLANKFGCFFYTDGLFNHVFSKQKLPFSPFELGRSRTMLERLRCRLARFLNPPDREFQRPSLLMSDFDLALSTLKKKQRPTKIGDFTN